MSQLDNHTLIHNTWYDLTGFNHPGGPVPIQLASMRDATALFELHHPFTDKVMLQKILKKYELSEEEVAKRELALDEKEQNDEEFVWEENDAFREALVKEVRAYFQGIADERGIKLLEATKISVGTSALLIFFVVMIIVLYPFYLMGYWFTLLLLPIFIWLTTTRMMHDGSHFAVARNWKINQIMTHAAPWAASSSTWFIQHVIGHHAHTNIPERDPDLYHGVENWRYVPVVEWDKKYSNQHRLFPLIWAGSTITTAFLAELFNSEYYNGITHVGTRTTKYYRFFFWFRMVLNLAFFGAPILTAGVLKGIFFFLYMWIILSIIFMAFTQISHLDELCGTSRHTNFWKHQLLVTSDYSCESTFWNYASIGLNCQSIHHSFPTINSCHFPALYPIFKAVTEKHGVTYQVRKTYWAALKEYWNVLKLYSVPDDSTNQALISVKVVEV